MAEAMTVELIIDAYWSLKGYWTHPKFSFQTERGMVRFRCRAYHPSEKVLVISESGSGKSNACVRIQSIYQEIYQENRWLFNFAEWESGQKITSISSPIFTIFGRTI
jgi:hypothetical protein